MQKNKIPYIVGASSLALILLFIIQVKWMQKSERLIEEQFDQKVSMALCSAVEDMGSGASSKNITQKCKTEDSNCEDLINSFLNSLNMREEVQKALAFYKIDMPYEIQVGVADKDSDTVECINPKNTAYSCSLNPIINNDDLELSLNFIGKSAYVRKEMGLMLILSILILMFISSVFIYANYYLIQQKRISERNREFFNHMAHEFKTPLTNIGLASKMLLKRQEDPLINIIHSENTQLSAQLNKVLSMASLESGQFEIKKENVEVNALIKEVVDSMKMQLYAKNGLVKIKGLDSKMYISADQFHVVNALKNILENAIKYNDKEPIIEIKARKLEDKIVISIQDNGVGIESKNQDLVFDKFFRLQKNKNALNRGFGLGLSYVKKIVNLHNGEILIFSEWKKGTRFDIQFPKPVQI